MLFQLFQLFKIKNTYKFVKLVSPTNAFSGISEILLLSNILYFFYNYTKRKIEKNNVVCNIIEIMYF